jgi:poly-gamma-glutamate synthesis protein (capsule biosynthesis protein)
MSKEELTLAIVGDIYVQREDPLSAFAFTREPLAQADIAFGNQEVALSTKGAPIIPGKVVFRSEPRMVEALTHAGIDVVGLANNHSMDYGPEAILETLDVLDRAGIGHAGAGANLEEAHKPALLERKGTKIAFLSYSSVFIPDFFPAQKDRPGIAVVRLNTAYQPHRRVFEQPASPALAIATPDGADFARMLQDVQRAKAKADVVVVAWHWGVSEGYMKIVDYQRKMGKAAVDAGADIVVGHHPHMLQGVEVYKGKTIFYSLGNFAFDYPLAHAGRETIIVLGRIAQGRIKQISFLPAMINEKKVPILLDLKKGKDVVDLVQRLSSDLGTHFELAEKEVLIKI